MTAVSSSRSARWPQMSKYEIRGELGRGGMATVYLAHDARLGRDVAIKVLHPHLRDSGELSHRFAVEARAVAKLRHPNILEVYDVSDEEEEEHFLVVELLDGLTLRKLLHDYGVFPPEVAAAVGLELAEALAHAHAQGVVHRDVKPENVMIEHASFVPLNDIPAPTKERAFRMKLTDFGIAKLLDSQGVTATGQVLGSPAHMSPEQIEGGEVDVRADVFGLGVLLYECMVGHLPFEGANPAQVLRRVLDGEFPPAERERPTVGKEWSAILDCALARRAEDRYPSASAMCDALRRELDVLGVTDPRAHLIAFLTDPKAYVEAEQPRLLTTLRELGETARRERRYLEAGSRYNRILALAPQDAEALRIVARLRRGESALSFVRRRVVPGILVAFLGVGAFFGSRYIARSGVLRPPISGVPTGVTTPTAPVPTTPPSVIAIATSTSTAVEPSTRPTSAAALATTPAAPKRRHVRIAALRPLGGVRVSVDGDGARDVAAGQDFELDDRAHELSFSCVEDMCEASRRTVAASDQDEALVVDLRIKPATVIVSGDPSRSYTVKEHPGRFRVETKVQMTRGAERVTVVELETGQTRYATLRAGASTTVSFTDDTPHKP